MRSVNSLNHTRWECRYHIIFIPKYRRKVLFGEIRRELGEVFHRLARLRESLIEEGHLLQDHVHMMISIPPKYAVAQVIGYIKGKNAIHIARHYSGRKRNYMGQHFGAREYFASTVGRDEEIIRTYIRHQEQGGICIQGAAYETLPKRLPFEYENLGEQQLKGFDDPVRAYAVSLKEGDVIPDSRPKILSEKLMPDIPEKPSIAVLAFTNMSGDPEQEFFSDGITEDITTALSHFSGLFVIARNSSFTYKGHAVDTRKISSELGVRYVLEGSVRRSGNRIRISGQLINAETGNHIWAERFDGDLDDIFELQDEITHKIVGSIAPQIELAEVERGRGLQPARLSSYELSLKAKSLAYDAFRLGDADALQNAIDIANDALKQDPRNTQALWLLGVCQLDQYLYQWGHDSAGSLNRAIQTAERLINVDSSNAAGHVLRGTLRIHQREFDLAIPDFERSLSLNPNASLHLFFAAWGESLAGLTKLAKEHAELGIRLSPREMDLWMGVAYLALLQASFAEENFEDAIKWGRLAIQMHAKAPIRQTLMVACCAYTGNLEEAAQHAEELRAFSPDFIPTILRGELLLYRSSEHNQLLLEGLRKSGLYE